MEDNSTRRDARAAITRTLAANCACDEQDFMRDAITITEAREMSGRMRFPMWSKQLNVDTMGDGVVLSADRSRLDWLRENFAPQPYQAVFSAGNIAKLSELAKRDGQFLAGPDLKYACSKADLRTASSPQGVEIDLVERDGIPDLYSFEGFGEALSYCLDTARPDVLATVARRDGEVLGIAGASADTDDLWQIGIKVVSSARGGGIGRALVSRLTEAILDAGRIPYYSTSVSNIRSQAVAIALGYWPAWTEVYARDR